MAYTKQTWEDFPSTRTLVTKATLDHIEQGIYDAHEKADKAITKPTSEGTSGQILATDGKGNTYWKDEEKGGGGGEKTTDYNDLTTNLPQINGITLKGNKTTKDLGIDIPSIEGLMQEPKAEGTSGQVLTTDGKGGRSWSTVQGGSGTNVVANPEGTPTTDLNTIQIGDDIYNIVGGGSGASGVSITTLFETDTYSENITLLDSYENYDFIMLEGYISQSGDIYLHSSWLYDTKTFSIGYNIGLTNDNSYTWYNINSTTNFSKMSGGNIKCNKVIGIKINKGGGEGGTKVIANPTDEGTDDLIKISIDGTIYNIPKGGSGGDFTKTSIYHDGYVSVGDSRNPTNPLAVDNFADYDYLEVEMQHTNGWKNYQYIDVESFRQLTDNYVSLVTGIKDGNGITLKYVDDTTLNYGGYYCGITNIYGIKLGSGSGGSTGGGGVYYSNILDIYAILNDGKYNKVTTEMLVGFGLLPAISSTSDENFANIIFSSEYSMGDGARWRPFDSTNEAGNWSALNGIEGQYLGYKFNLPVKIGSVGLRGRRDGYSTENIKSFKVQYSDDGIDWFDASDILEFETNPTALDKVTFDGITEQNYHQYWRVYALTNWGDGNRVAIGKMQFYSDASSLNWKPVGGSGSGVTEERVQEMIDNAIGTVLEGSF